MKATTFLKATNVIEMLSLLVIPGYPSPLAAQLSRTLTAVKVPAWSLAWRHSAQICLEKGM